MGESVLDDFLLTACLSFCLLCCVHLGTFILSEKLFHYFQLESYQFAGYLKTIRRQKKVFSGYLLLYAAAVLVLGGVCSLVFVSFRSMVWIRIFVSVVLCATGVFAAVYIRRKYCAPNRKEKKPFAVTKRIRRHYAAYALMSIACAFLLSRIQPGIVFSAVIPLIPLAAPLLVILSAVLAWPVEKAIYLYYFTDTKNRLLRQKDLIRIGITGSYGKTSVKFILNTILSERFLTLATPSSFNTPMGISRIVRERLEPRHQVFIAEMGARHRGDIRELCRLVHPQIGMLTSVGPQHLDTFKSLDRIRNTKYDLIRSLPPSGFAVFSDDQGIVKSLYQQTKTPESVLIGCQGDEIWADQIHLSSAGSDFTVHVCGSEYHCRTRLLGEHSIRNILICYAVAKHLGMNDAEIIRGIGKIEPVEHRLQLLPVNGKGVIVIDDAFNSNPQSSTIALDILAGFSGKRIIVTPGMVELGTEEERYNYEFGKHMAECADCIILVGKKHTAPIQKALRDSGSKASCHIVNSLSEAIVIADRESRAGDVILYENDLPDNYDE